MQRWPYCGVVQGNCMMYQFGDALGADLTTRLIEFIASSGDGSRMTLQRNRDGFSLQVTEGVLHGNKERLSLERIRGLSEKWDRR